MRRPALLAILVSSLGLGSCQIGGRCGMYSGPPIEPDRLEVATFFCDATPPVGHPLCGGWITPVVDVQSPLLLKGIVLTVRDDDRGVRSRFVLASLDWCRLQTGAYERLRRALAEAAGLPQSNVLLHTVHQHDAPIADADAQLLLDREINAPPHLDLTFFNDLTKRAAAALQDALVRGIRCVRIGYGKAKVEQFASNRRSVIADGKILQRGSSSKDPRHHEAPEGLIDPWLRTISLYGEDKRAVARLHFYASHPQSVYGEGHVSSDTAGLARERIEKTEGVFQVYFTGCGGNVAAGKYNRGTPEDRNVLMERLYSAMKRSIAGSARVPLQHHLPFLWTSTVRFALRTEPEFAEERFRSQIADPAGKPVDRLKAALALAWYERWKQNPEIELSAIRLGPIHILSLPGEAFVEYQLYAQSLRPDDFVCVAAYGDCGPGYICLDDDLTKGGYEPTMSLVGPPSEQRLKAAIAELLK